MSGKKSLKCVTPLGMFFSWVLPALWLETEFNFKTKPEDSVLSPNGYFL